MDFGKLARKRLTDPCAIRRVEEANPRLQPISHDDIINMKITLGIYNQDVMDFIEMDCPRRLEEEEPCLDSFSL